jgi:hypothetical protein
MNHHSFDSLTEPAEVCQPVHGLIDRVIAMVS